MRVLVVGKLPPPLGGIAQYVQRLASEGVGAGVEIEVFNTTKFSALPGEYGGVWKGEFRRTILNIWFSLNLVPQFITKLLRSKYDIVHVHVAHGFGFWWHAMFIAVARCMKKPVVLHLHGSRFEGFYAAQGRVGRSLIRGVLRTCEFCVALSPQLAKRVGELVEPEKVIVIPNGVPSVFLSPGDRNEVNSKCVGLFVGALVERKGVADLLYALAAIPSDRGIEIRFVGPGDPAQWRRISDKLGLSERVEWVGPLEGGELVSAYHGSDFFVLPSYAEGVPLAILEAMAAALPVIASDVGGIPEVVHHGYGGWLVHAGDTESLAAAVAAAAADGARRSEFGRYNRTLIEERYLWEKTQDALRGVYLSVARGSMQ